MDPADSAKVSRDSTYSGYFGRRLDFAYGALTLYDSPFQTDSTILSLSYSAMKSYYPSPKIRLVWATPLSLAATYGIDFSFCSSGYLDVSVLQVGYMNLWIQFTYVRESKGQLLFNGSP